jgi:hypothetical protein
VSNFIKIFSLEAELFSVDGQPDRQPDVRKLIVAFRNFVTAPKKIYRCSFPKGLKETHQADNLVSWFQAKKLFMVSAKPSRLCDKESYLNYEQN